MFIFTVWAGKTDTNPNNIAIVFRDSKVPCGGVGEHSGGVPRRFFTPASIFPVIFEIKLPGFTKIEIWAEKFRQCIIQFEYRTKSPVKFRISETSTRGFTGHKLDSKREQNDILHAGSI